MALFNMYLSLFKVDSSLLNIDPSLSDMTHGRIGDMCEMGVTESYQVKKQVLVSAAEAAEMIVRVDNIVKAAPR